MIESKRAAVFLCCAQPIESSANNKKAAPFSFSGRKRWKRSEKRWTGLFQNSTARVSLKRKDGARATGKSGSL